MWGGGEAFGKLQTIKLNKMQKYCYVGKSVIEGFQKKNMRFPQYSMHNCPMRHFAVFANDTSYEVTGETPQEVRVSKISEKDFLENFELLHLIKCNISSTFHNDAVKFITTWCSKHPTYSFVDANCQTFVQDFAEKFFGVVVETQSEQYRNYGYTIFSIAKRVFVISLATVMVLIMTGSLFILYAWSISRARKIQ